MNSATTLPPQTSTGELLRELWQGNTENLHKTECWLQVSVNPEGIEIADKDRPGVVFIPILKRDARRPTRMSMSEVLLVKAGRRIEKTPGQVEVNTLYEPASPVALIEPFIFGVEGFSGLPKEMRDRLRSYFQISFSEEEDETGSETARLINRSHELYGVGRLAEALETVEQVLAVNPDSADGWSNKGAILAAMGRREEALDCYDQAIRLLPHYQKALVNKAATPVKLGRHREAIECCEVALAADATNAEAWNNKAYALQQMGREGQARSGAGG